LRLLGNTCDGLAPTIQWQFTSNNLVVAMDGLVLWFDRFGADVFEISETGSTARMLEHLQMITDATAAAADVAARGIIAFACAKRTTSRSLGVGVDKRNA
jgi:hypothetical protein